MGRKHAIPPDALARQEMLSRAAGSNAENGSAESAERQDSTSADTKEKSRIYRKQGPPFSQADE